MTHKAASNTLNLLVVVLVSASAMLAGCIDRPTNNPPTARNDQATVSEGASRSISSADNENVLNNDEDPDGDPLVVSETPITDVRHGTLVLHADGSWEYQHDGSETISDSFVYEISDGKGGTDRATVTIEIEPVNDPPVIAPDQVFSVDENSPGSTPVGTVEATDADSTVTAYAITGGNIDGAFDIDSAGRLTVAAGAALDHETRESYTLTIKVTNSETPPQSVSGEVTINITDINDLPEATGSCRATVQAVEQPGMSGTLQGSDAEDGSNVTFALGSDGSAGNGPLTTDRGGSVSLVDPSTGAYTYTPPSGNDKRGITDTFRFQVRDSQGATASATETIKIGLNIMPLGDSITAGEEDVGGADGLPDIPQRTGYRKPLYQSLIGAGYKVDFVGRLNQGCSAGYDSDAEGWPGYTAEQLAGAVPGVARKRCDGSSIDFGSIGDSLDANPADIILLHIGTNDVSTTGGEDVAAILDEIDLWEQQNSHPVTVILARIIDQWHWKNGIGGDSHANGVNNAVGVLNNEIDAMVAGRIANGDDIILVDMQSALDYPGDLDDLSRQGVTDWHYRLHPSSAGYAKMADVWLYPLTGQGTNKVTLGARGPLLDKCP